MYSVGMGWIQSLGVARMLYSVAARMTETADVVAPAVAEVQRVAVVAGKQSAEV